jgi:hypothetical protein
LVFYVYIVFSSDTIPFQEYGEYVITRDHGDN